MISNHNAFKPKHKKTLHTSTRAPANAGKKKPSETDISLGRRGGLKAIGLPFKDIVEIVDISERSAS
jgi:hypothetical protein